MSAVDERADAPSSGTPPLRLQAASLLFGRVLAFGVAGVSPIVLVRVLSVG